MSFMGNSRVDVWGEDQLHDLAMHAMIIPFAQIINSDTGITSADLALGRIAVMISPGAGVRGLPVTEGTFEEITGFVTAVDVDVTADGTNVPKNVKMQVNGLVCCLYATDNAPALGDRVVLSTERGKVRKSVIIVDTDNNTAAGQSIRGGRDWVVVAIRTASEEVDLLLL